MPFFTYIQNNSGGHFFSDGNVAKYVIIEALNDAHADSLALDIGIYFDGCEKGYDCDCCGDRWSRQFEDGDEVPSLYGQSIFERKVTMSRGMRENLIVHYLDGRKEKVVV